MKAAWRNVLRLIQRDEARRAAALVAKLRWDVPRDRRERAAFDAVCALIEAKRAQ